MGYGTDRCFPAYSPPFVSSFLFKLGLSFSAPLPPVTMNSLYQLPECLLSMAVLEMSTASMWEANSFERLKAEKYTDHKFTV